MSTDNEIEQEIQAKGLTAPRVTPADVRANIVNEIYFTGEEALIGALTTGTGASPENFDAEIGRTVAYENAVNKIWPLMGYALKEKLSGE
jgi:hypothetical protein